MYFNSDRPGGFGLRDIYISRRTNTAMTSGGKSPSMPAGDQQRFLGRRASYLANEEAGTPLLYFGSTRPAGLFDIYVSAQAADGSWGPAVLVRGAQQSTERAAPQRPLRWSGAVPGLGPSGHLRLRDLWVSTRETTLDPWSAPVNLGVTVNSAFIDQTPSIASDRETLFFASNRPGGLGNLDIYITTRERTRTTSALAH